MEEGATIYLSILREELTPKQIAIVLKEFFSSIQNSLEEIITGVLKQDYVLVRNNLKTIQILATTMYAPYIAEFALLCETYAEVGKESCLKESLVLLFKQVTLVMKECYAEL